MRRTPILAGARHGWQGMLLDWASRLPGVGGPFARAQRVRRKRLRALLQASDGPMPELLRAEEIRDCDQHLLAWQNLPPRSTGLEPVGGSPPDPWIRCSVVINTVDRARELGETLGDLGDQWQADRDELIVVLGPTTDHSRDVIANAGLRCRVIDCPERNLAVSRNLGLAAARGTYIAYLDDDASPCAGWLERLLGPLEDDPACGVSAGFAMDGSGARFLTQYVVADPLGDSTWWATWEDAQSHLQEEPHRFLTATGCSMAFRREAVAAIGGFDPFYAYFLEETDLVLRLRQAGLHCAPAPDSLVLHRQGDNIARTTTAPPAARLRVLTSQLHFIRKFAAGVPADAIHRSVWRRILTDLERIAWECPRDAFAHQADYLRALCEELARHRSE